jgi:HEPN domain-containing protein
MIVSGTAAERLKRAGSSLLLALESPLPEGVMFEDLCYQCRQTAEKSPKAVLIHPGKELPRKHSLAGLLDLLSNCGIEYPEEVRMAGILTSYAMETRYPGDYEPVGKEELDQSRQTDEAVYPGTENQVRGGCR